MSRAACAIAAVASLSDLPGARLNDSVVATNWLWWLTASGVTPGAEAVNPLIGDMDSAAVETALAEEDTVDPVAASEACDAVLTACAALDAVVVELELEDVLDDKVVEGTASDTTLLIGAKLVLEAEATAEDKVGAVGLIAATVGVGTVVGAPAETELSAVVSEPLAGAPEELMKICESDCGRCQNAGETSITT